MIVDIGKGIIIGGVFIAQILLLVLLKAYVLRNKPKLTPWNWAQRFLLFVKKNGLLIAAITATLAMSGSLFFSEVAKYTPCLLCWFQRIAMFPQVLLLWIAKKRNDANIVWYSVPLAAIGALIAAYHYLLQSIPRAIAKTGFCDLDNPCTARFIYESYLTIAMMALTAFVIIIVALVMHYKYRKATNKPAKKSSKQK